MPKMVAKTEEAREIKGAGRRDGEVMPPPEMKPPGTLERLDRRRAAGEGDGQPRGRRRCDGIGRGAHGGGPGEDILERPHRRPVAGGQLAGVGWPWGRAIRS